jgi:hypothetical protein
MLAKFWIQTKKNAVVNNCRRRNEFVAKKTNTNTVSKFKPYSSHEFQRKLQKRTSHRYSSTHRSMSLFFFQMVLTLTSPNPNLSLSLSHIFIFIQFQGGGAIGRNRARSVEVYSVKHEVSAWKFKYSTEVPNAWDYIDSNCRCFVCCYSGYGRGWTCWRWFLPFG